MEGSFSKHHLKWEWTHTAKLGEENLQSAPIHEIATLREYVVLRPVILLRSQ